MSEFPSFYFNRPHVLLPRPARLTVRADFSAGSCGDIVVFAGLKRAADIVWRAPHVISGDTPRSQMFF